MCADDRLDYAAFALWTARLVVRAEPVYRSPDGASERNPLVNDVGSDVAVRALDELLILARYAVDDHRSNEAAVWIEAAVAGIDIAATVLGSQLARVAAELGNG